MEADALRELHAELRSDKTTKRKAALKQLDAALASADLVRSLDATTADMDGGRGGDVKRSWAGLCGSLMVCVAAEIAAGAGRKGPANKLTGGILRRFVAVAEDAKRKARSGVVAPLRRRAGKLFAHILEVLREGPPEYASEYTQLLRAHVLPEPAYCARAKATTYEAIVAAYVERLEPMLARDRSDDDDADARGGALHGDDANRCAQTLLQLLRSCPHDLSPAAALPDVVSFLGDALRGLAETERAAKLPATLLTALNACLARGGLDLSPATSLARLYRDTAPIVAKALKGDGANRAANGGGYLRGDDRRPIGGGGGGERGGRAADERLRSAATTHARLPRPRRGSRGSRRGGRPRGDDRARGAFARGRRARGTERGRRRRRRRPPDFALSASHAAACALAADVFVAQCRSPGVDGRWRPDVVTMRPGDGVSRAGRKRDREDAAIDDDDDDDDDEGGEGRRGGLGGGARARAPSGSSSVPSLATALATALATVAWLVPRSRGLARSRRGLWRRRGRPCSARRSLGTARRFPPRSRARGSAR